MQQRLQINIRDWGFYATPLLWGVCNLARQNHISACKPSKAWNVKNVSSSEGNLGGNAVASGCRVACQKKGGIRYTINGNRNYLLVPFSTLADPESSPRRSSREIIQAHGAPWRGAGEWTSLAVLTFAAKDSAWSSSPAECPTSAGLSAGHTKAVRCIEIHCSDRRKLFSVHQHMIQRTGPAGTIYRRNRKYSKLLVQICWVVGLVFKKTRMICIRRTLPGWVRRVKKL